MQAAAAVVALHATDPASVFLSAWARMADGSVEAVERALYEDRTLLRMLAMRRTVWVVPAVDAPVVQAGASDTVAERERRKLLAALEEADVAPDADAWLREVEAVALRILAGREALTAAELSRADPRLATELVLARGKNYEGRQKVASRVLLVLAASGLAVRARPRGSWSSSQFRWTALDAWCPEAAVRHEAETAETELARRWLAAFGPATVEDLRWWTGWTLGVTRRALAGVDTVDVELDGGASGLVAAADAAPPPPVEPWAVPQ